MEKEKKQIIHATYDYNIIIPSKHNRELNENHIKYMENSKFDLLKGKDLPEARKLPNGKWQLLSGHHRLEYCKRNNLPFYWIESDKTDLEALIAELSTKPWNNAEGCIAYAKLGYKEYKKIIDLANDTGLEISRIFRYIGGKFSNNISFKTGQYIHNMQRDALIRNIIASAKRILSISDVKFTKEYFHSFIATILWLTLNAKDYTEEMLISKLKNYPQFLNTRVAAVRDIIENLENLVNKRPSAKIEWLYLYNKSRKAA